MIDLCIDGRMAFSSGIGRVIRNLVPHLAMPPLRIHLLCQSKDRAQWDLHPGIQVVDCDAPIYSVSEQIAVPWKIPKCDLFWSPHFNIPLLPIRAKKRIVTIHDTYHLAFQKTLRLDQKIYAQVMLRRAVSMSDRIVVPSHFTRKELEFFFGSLKIDIIPNGLNHNEFHSLLAYEKLGQVRHKYQLPKDFFLFVGNLKPHKNISGILQAYELFSQTYPSVSLVLVGQFKHLRTVDPVVSRLFEQSKLDRRVILLEGVSDGDLPFIYRAASSLLFPSHYEGFGLPPLEAMACGCPTIVSTSASLPEVCGEASIYVAPFDPSALAEAMGRVWTDALFRNEFIRKGLMHAQQYSWEKMAEQYRQLLIEMSHEI